MKSYFRLSYLLPFLAITLFGCDKVSSLSSNQTIDSPFSIADSRLRTFLDTNDPEVELSILKQYGEKRLDLQYMNFNPVKGLKGEYQFYYDTDPNFSSPKFYFPKWGNFQLLTPGEKYYYRLYQLTGEYSSRPYKNFSESFTFPTTGLVQEGSFETKDEVVRYLNIQKIGNFRDIGGWKTVDNKKVKYGLIYRGPSLDTLTNFASCQLHDMLSIKTEIDLRAESTITKSAFGADFLLKPTAAYDNIYRDALSRNYKDIFSCLANKDSYPVVFHCAAGADRTGTLAFLINGLLGVDLPLLTKDFELTSFSDYGYRTRGPLVSPYVYGKGQDDADNYVNWGQLVDTMKTYGSSTDSLSVHIEKYLVNTIGVSSAEIKSIRSIMLGE